MLGSRLCSSLPALGAPAASALVAIDDAHHRAARQQARQEAHHLVAEARNHDALPGHEAVIADLRDLVGCLAQETWRRRLVDAGVRLKSCRDRTWAKCR